MGMIHHLSVVSEELGWECWQLLSYQPGFTRHRYHSNVELLPRFHDIGRPCKDCRDPLICCPTCQFEPEKALDIFGNKL